jgi:nucleoside-diphosphate-sugar epimerase
MITVLGASGYIGSGIVKKLEEMGVAFYLPGRNEDLKGKELGNVIYCIGLTADFRTKPFETVEAHVCLLNKILKECSFESLTYLSSTRLYINSQKETGEEEDKILVDPLEPDELYTLTKLTGERICMSSGKLVKIARLSNVFGNDHGSTNFLADIIKNIEECGEVVLFSALSSSKDYIFIDDAVDLILKIALQGKEKIYNVASGINTTNAEIITALKSHKEFSCTVKENAREICFAKISTKKIVTEFNFQPNNIIQQISTLLKTT